MKHPRRTRLTGQFVLKAGLLAAMFVVAFLLPVYGQQEVDPTWYDPWPTRSKVSDTARLRHADQKAKRKVSSVTSNKRPPKARVKGSTAAAANRSKNTRARSKEIVFELMPAGRFPQ